MLPSPDSNRAAGHRISEHASHWDSCWELLGTHHDQTDPYLYWNYVVTLWRRLGSRQIAATLSYTPQGTPRRDTTSQRELELTAADGPSRPESNPRPTIATTTVFSTVEELMVVFTKEPSMWHGGRPSDVPDGALHYPRLAACRIAATHAPEGSRATTPTRNDTDPRIEDGLRWHRASETIFHHYRDLYTVYASWCSTAFNHDPRRLHPRAMGIGFNIAARQLANTPGMREGTLPLEPNGLITRPHVTEALKGMLTSRARPSP